MKGLCLLGYIEIEVQKVAESTGKLVIFNEIQLRQTVLIPLLSFSDQKKYTIAFCTFIQVFPLEYKCLGYFIFNSL